MLSFPARRLYFNDLQPSQGDFIVSCLTLQRVKFSNCFYLPGKKMIAPNGIVKLRGYNYFHTYSNWLFSHIGLGMKALERIKSCYRDDHFWVINRTSKLIIFGSSIKQKLLGTNWQSKCTNVFGGIWWDNNWYPHGWRGASVAPCSSNGYTYFINGFLKVESQDGILKPTPCGWVTTEMSY